mgnify:CR=1 FL=1
MSSWVRWTAASRSASQPDVERGVRRSRVRPQRLLLFRREDARLAQPFDRIACGPSAMFPVAEQVARRAASARDVSGCRAGVLVFRPLGGASRECLDGPHG